MLFLATTTIMSNNLGRKLYFQLNHEHLPAINPLKTSLIYPDPFGRMLIDYKHQKQAYANKLDRSCKLLYNVRNHTMIRKSMRGSIPLE